MASKNEEYIAVAAVLVSLIVLSILFGVLWSFLLVFTFLLLVYLFGRPQTERKISTKYRVKKDSVQNSLDESEQSSPIKEMDVPFTGLSSPKHSLHSPMPLLSSFSTVTKRLSFNQSSFSHQDGKMYANARRRLSTTLGSSRESQMSPKHYFSLINPILNQPSTVKIATPQVNNRTFTLVEPVELTESPLNRNTILSALKQSSIRKRSVVEDEDNNEEVSSSFENQKKKRRYNYPSVESKNSKLSTETNNTANLELTREIINEPPAVTRKSSGIYSLIQTRLKRRPLHDNESNTDTEREVVKKTKQDFDTTAGLSKVTERTETQESESTCISGNGQNSTTSISKRVSTKDNYDDDNDSGCDADDDDDVIMKVIPINNDAKRLSKRQAQKLSEENTTAHTPKKSPSRQQRTHSCTPDLTPSRQQRVSKKQRQSNTPIVSKMMTTSNNLKDSENPDISGQEMSPKKRFTVIRFPSKKDEAKRRPVPVYCASVNSPDLPKRRSVTHKITKEDIELDRKLAWQRVQALLDDGSEDDEDKSKTDTSSPVAIHVTTCMPSPAKSSTMITATTTAGTQASSTLVTSTTKETQPTTLSTTALSTITPGLDSTQPTLLTSLAATKPNEVTVQAFVPKPSESSTTPLTSALDAKTTIKEALRTSFGSGPTGQQPSLSSPTKESSAQGFSLNLASSMTSTISAAGLSAPVTNIFGTTASKSLNPVSLASITTSSQSVQTPICTPVAQVLLNPKAISTIQSATSAPASFSQNFGSTTSNLPQMGVNSQHSLQVGTSISSFPSQKGFNGSSNPPQSGLSTSSNLPQMGFNTPSNPPQMGLNMSSNPSQSGLNTSSNLPQMGLNTPSNPPQMGLNTSSNPSQSGLNTSSNLPKLGLNTPSHPFQTGFNTPSNLLKSNFGSTNSAGQISTDVSYTTTSSLFSGLNASASVAISATKVTTQESQPGFAAPGGFSFNAPSVPKTASQASSFSFGGNQQTSNGFVFGATPKTTHSSFQLSTGASHNTFGSGVTTTTNAFGSNSTSIVLSAPSTTSTPAFGPTSTSSQSTFGNAGASGTTGGFKFGTNTAAQNIFGSAKQPTTVSSAPSLQFSFGSNTSGNAPSQTQSKVDFSFAVGKNPTATPQTFGAAPSQPSGFGVSANTNPFGALPTQGPFGAPSNQNAFGGSATQTTFGSPATQNVFGNPAGTSGTGGFGFGGGAATNTPSAGGFKFGGASGVSSGFQSTTSAAPAFGSTPSATPVPTGGFNFSASTNPNNPAFGATPAGSGGFAFGSGTQAPSSAVARPRSKVTATRRRQRK